MDVLIAVASRHHATAELAERVADTLRERGHSVDLVEADASRWLDDEHDAYIVGSAIYMDRWMKSARQFLDANEAVLSKHPVWLFSSGPVHGTAATAVSKSVAPLPDWSSIRPIEHRVFPGRLDPDALGVVERVAARAFGARAGDHRNWGEVERWAAAIADVLGDLDAARRDDVDVEVFPS